MTARTQITLDVETEDEARATAAELGLTFEQYVATLIARDIELLPTQQEAAAPFDIAEMFDLGSSDDPTDIARDKGRLIGDATASEYQRRMHGKQPSGHDLHRYIRLVRSCQHQGPAQRPGEGTAQSPWPRRAAAKSS